MYSPDVNRNNMLYKCHSQETGGLDFDIFGLVISKRSGPFGFVCNWGRNQDTAAHPMHFYSDIYPTFSEVSF